MHTIHRSIPVLVLLATLAGAEGCAAERVDDADVEAAQGDALVGRAGPAADYELGTGIDFYGISFRDQDGNPGSVGGRVQITKAGSALGFVLDPATFGAPASIGPITVNATVPPPTPTGEDGIILSASTSPHTYDGQTTIHTVTANVPLRARWIPVDGQVDCTASGCRNVALSVLPGATVTVTGEVEAVAGWGFTSSSFTKTFTITSLSALAGLPPPRTTSLRLQGGTVTANGETRVCSPTRARTFYGDLGIDVPASSNGAYVPMGSSNAAVTAYGPSITSGARSGLFQVSVPAGFVGTTTLYARDGSARMLPLRFATCTPPSTEGALVVRELLRAPEVLFPQPGCLACFVGDINARGEAVAMLATGPAFYDTEKKAWIPLDFAKGVQVDSIRLSELGTIAVSGTSAGKPYASMASWSSGKWDVKSLGALAPSWVSPFGAFGVGQDGKPGAVARSGKVTLAPLLGSLDGPIVAANDIGLAVATKQGAAFYQGTKAVPLANAGEIVDVAGISDSGIVAGTLTVTKDGTRQAMAYDTTNGKRTLLGVDAPNATSINSNGWIVGGSGKSAFLHVPGIGTKNLSSLVSPTAKLVIADVIRMTDAGEILVRGEVAGVPGLYVIDANAGAK